MPRLGAAADTRTMHEGVKRFKQRLAYALALSGKGQNEVARAVGASQSVASVWFDEGSEVLPGGKFLMRLPGVLGVNGHWLVTGEGEWHPVPVSGRKDVLLMEGVEIGTRDALAEVEGAVGRVRDRLARQVGSAILRARDALADAATDAAASAAHPERRKRGTQR